MLFKGIFYGLLIVWTGSVLTNAKAQNSNDRILHGSSILRPAVHWDTETDSLDTLVPNTTISFFYAPDVSTINNAASVQLAWTHMTFKVPVVALDHSSLIESVTCSRDRSMKIVFADTQAFNVALKWPMMKTIVTGHNYKDHHSGCQGVDEEMDRYYARSVSAASFVIYMYTNIGHVQTNQEDIVTEVYPKKDITDVV